MWILCMVLLHTILVQKVAVLKNAEREESWVHLCSLLLMKANKAFISYTHTVTCAYKSVSYSYITTFLHAQMTSCFELGKLKLLGNEVPKVSRF